MTDLVGAGVGARRVHQAEGDSPSARLYSRCDLALRGTKLAVVRCPLRPPEDGVAHRPMGDEGTQRDGWARTVQFVQVLADRPLGPLGGTGAFGQSQLRHPVGEPLIRNGCGTHPVGVY